MDLFQIYIVWTAEAVLINGLKWRRENFDYEQRRATWLAVYFSFHSVLQHNVFRPGFQEPRSSSHAMYTLLF